jgi:hypothetical protein
MDRAAVKDISRDVNEPETNSEIKYNILYFVSLQYPSITKPDSSGNTVTEQQTLWI